MNDFIVDDRYEDGVVVTLHPNVRMPRVIMPFIVGCVAAVIAAAGTPAMSGHSASGAGPIQGVVSIVFVALSALCFLQVAISAFGNQAWQATANRLEFRQELFGFRLAKRVPGQVILLSPPTAPQSTAWKLMAAPDAGSEHFWKVQHIHISSDDDELRELGKLLATSTGWPFVEEAH